MARKRIYCVQTFWRVGGRVEAGPAEQFMHPEDALAAGQARAARGQGLAVYSLCGEPAADHWDEAEVMLRVGAAP